MKKSIFQSLTFGLLFLLSCINTSFSQIVDSNGDQMLHHKKAKSNITYLNSFIHQPNVEKCLLVSVVFKLENVYGNPIMDAVINFGEVENDPGNYIFEGIEKGKYNYTITKVGYLKKDGEVIITVDSSKQNVSIILIEEMFTIKFNIIDEYNNEITDAVITFEGEKNDAGKNTLDGIKAGIYNYKVEKSGFQPYEDIVEVMDQDLTINVILQDSNSSSTRVSFLQRMTILPNPNLGQFILEITFEPGNNNVWLIFLDSTGKIVYRIQENLQNESFIKEFDLSFLPQGFYYMQIVSKKNISVEKFIIN